MAPPIVIEFGVYGATFDCVNRIEYLADLFLIPLFIATMIFGMLLLMMAGVTTEQKKRWKVRVLHVCKSL